MLRGFLIEIQRMDPNIFIVDSVRLLKKIVTSPRLMLFYGVELQIKGF